MRYGRAIVVLIAGLGVSGCANDFSPHATVPTSGTADTDKALSAAISSVERAMTQMQSANPTATAVSEAKDQSYVPEELLRPFDINVTNVSVDEVAQKLAAAAGYKIDIVNPLHLGSPPITIAGQRVPLIDLFRRLGDQGGSQVYVLVNADVRTVHVVYRKDPADA